MLLSSECKMFEDDWANRKIENTTALNSPVLHGTVIPIQCVGGFEKLSGPDAVNCIENTTFYGLDDVICSGEYTTTSALKS